MSFRLHHHTDDLAHIKGLRVVATFEILKGAVAVVGALALLHYLHRDVLGIAANLLDKLHVPPGASLATLALEGADSVTPHKIQGLIGFAIFYSAIRFLEGYGLWLARVWAEWFAMISGGVYLPLEVYEILHKVSWLHLAVLLVNVAIVLYMASLRIRARRSSEGTEEEDLRGAA